MIERGLYYTTLDFAQMVKNAGGQWNDTKHRPRDIRSCFYHVGRTTNKSIFFVSDAVPITERYIAEEHLDKNKNHYIIKNPNLISELQRKLFRLLSVENSKPNYFRQHISDVKKHLLLELGK